jgi:predicted metal-dependent HD superfamily phosphohydrolase
MANEDLQEAWDSLAERLGLQAESSKQIYSTLLAAYSAPERHYHTLDHISRMLSEFQEYRKMAADADWLDLAIWFHDSVYDFGASDNEEKSADLAEKLLKEEGLPELALSRIHDYVMATKHDTPPEGFGSELIADLDLAVLAVPYDQFLEYRNNIWQEYQGRSLPEKFRLGTIKFYESMLAKPSIFHTDIMREKYEAKARSNIEMALSEMRA